MIFILYPLHRTTNNISYTEHASSTCSQQCIIFLLFELLIKNTDIGVLPNYSRKIFFYNFFVNLFSMDGYFLGCIDADAYLITLDINNRYFYIIANHNGLALFSGQYKHDITPKCSFPPVNNYPLLCILLVEIISYGQIIIVQNNLFTELLFNINQYRCLKVYSDFINFFWNNDNCKS